MPLVPAAHLGFILTINTTNCSPFLQYYPFSPLPYNCWECCHFPCHPSPCYRIHCSHWKEKAGENKVANSRYLEWSHIYKNNIYLFSHIWKVFRSMYTKLLTVIILMMMSGWKWRSGSFYFLLYIQLYCWNVYRKSILAIFQIKIIHVHCRKFQLQIKIKSNM